MSDTAQNINYYGSTILPLTRVGFMVDTFSIKLPKGKKMDEKSGEAEPSHEDLMVKIASQKDRDAFRVIFYYFAPRLKSYLLNFKLDNQKAEDIVQDVMMTLWRKASTFDPEKAKLSTWLFRIARNKYIDHTRKQKYPELNADDHVDTMIAPEKTDRPLQQAQTAERIKKAMASLNEDQQKVIKLSFFNEMSHAEISSHLDLPLGTVKSRIRTAFQTLRRALGEYQ